MKIFIVEDIEEEDIDHVCKVSIRFISTNILIYFFQILGCSSIASLDHSKGGKFVKVINYLGKTISIIIQYLYQLMLEEADRFIHNTLCVIRCFCIKGNKKNH